MLRWSLMFFLISIVAGMLGFTNIAAGSAAIARVFFFFAITLFVIFLIAGLTVGKTVANKLQ